MPCGGLSDKYLAYNVAFDLLRLLMNLPFPLLLALEKSIETLLKMDPDTRERLSAVDGKTLQVNVRAPAISLLLSINDGCVQLMYPDASEGNDASADTTISGSLADLRSLLNGNEAVYSGDVLIEGDIGTSQQLKQIIAKIDPDWQDAISPYLGDGLTHRLDMAQARLGRWLERTRSSARINGRDYLQEELELLAPNSEVEWFCEQVDNLRANVDRLAARLQRIEAAREHLDDEG